MGILEYKFAKIKKKIVCRKMNYFCYFQIIQLVQD